MPTGTYTGVLHPGEKKMLMEERPGRTALTLQVEGGQILVKVGGDDWRFTSGLSLGPSSAHNAIWIAASGDNFPKSYTATEEW